MDKVNSEGVQTSLIVLFKSLISAKLSRANRVLKKTHTVKAIKDSIRSLKYAK